MTRGLHRIGASGGYRHILRDGHIQSPCGDMVVVSSEPGDDPGAPWCRACRRVALLDLALAVQALGLPDVALRIAEYAREGDDWAPGELTEAWGK